MAKAKSRKPNQQPLGSVRSKIEMYSKASPLYLAENSVVDRAITIIGKWGTYINGKSYQQEALVTHNGWQYTTYYDAQRRPFLFFRT